MPGANHGVTYEDAWQLLAETEAEYHCFVEIVLFPPRSTPSGLRLPCRLSITATFPKSNQKALSRLVDVGGTRGARSVPAALVRGLSEVGQGLDDRLETAAQLAAS